MSATNIDESEIRSFLLGTVSDDDRERMEGRFVVEPAYREQVLAIEHELMDDYLDGMLTPLEQQNFHQHLASTTEQQQELRITGLIKERSPVIAGGRASQTPVNIGSRRPSGRLTIRPALIAIPIAALVLIAIGFGLIKGVRSWRQNHELIEAENRRLATEQRLVQLNKERNNGQKTLGRLFSATIPEVFVRNASPASRLNPPPDIGIVELRLAVTGNVYSEYLAELQRTGAAGRFAIPNLHVEGGPSGKAVVVWLPNEFVTDGDFEISLSVTNKQGQKEVIGEYNFQVTR